MESHDPSFIFLFARDVEGAYKKPLEKLILQIKNPEYAHAYARDVEGAKTKLLAKIVINSRNPKYCYHFAYDIKYGCIGEQDLDKFEDVVINSNSGKYNYLYIQNISTKRFREHLKPIVESKDPKYLYKFAEHFREELTTEELKLIEDKLFETRNVLYINSFIQIFKINRKIVYDNKNINIDDKVKKLSKLLEVS